MDCIPPPELFPRSHHQCPHGSLLPCMVHLSPPWPGASGEPKEIAGGSPHAMQMEKQVQSWPALRLAFPADPGFPISHLSPLSWGTLRQTLPCPPMHPAQGGGALASSPVCQTMCYAP